MEKNLWIALSLTLLAGLSTGIGSLMSLLSKKLNPNFLSGALGFSAGVMIYVSFIDLFPTSKNLLISTFGEKLGYFYAVFAFFAGILLTAFVDFIVPSAENPHEVHAIDDLKKTNNNLLRMGVFSAIAIAIHNIPEGIATFMASLKNPTLGISIAIAIAIHNIPEGIAVSVPIYFATKSRKKAFWLSFLSGLAEPLGAILGYLFLRPFFNDLTFGLIFSVIAGIMVYISFDELLPMAHQYGKNHIAIGGLVGGMFIIAISLLLFL